MPERVARIFRNGRSQAVPLPAEFRFHAKQVFVSKEGERVILSPRPSSWEAFFESGPRPTADFMATRVDNPPPARDLF